MSTLTRLPQPQIDSPITPPTRNGAPGTKRGKSLPAKILLGFLSTVKWIAITILALLAALLIAISFRWGPTPPVVALLLAAAWIGMLSGLVLAARRFRSGWAVLAATGGFVLLGLATVVISQVSAYTPPIVDAQGQVVPGSIASLEQVNLNGTDEWISIRGESTHNPVLLFLAGGPGGSQLGTLRRTLGALEAHFVVVNWEQPGSGKSFDAVDRAQMTPERYIADGHALVQYLRQRFGQEKVYVLGESWGSALGIMLVQRYPELFHAFMGTGQMVAFLETDQMCYDFAVQWAKERGDTGKVAQLERQGPPPYYGNGMAWTEAAYLLDTFSYMNQNPAINDRTDTISDLLAPEYGLYDKVNWARGPLDTLSYVYPHLWDVDFRTQATHLDVPVYFLIGRHDVNAPPVLTEQYYEVLQAPHKEIVWFEHSGHAPWDSEREAFADVVVNKVLAATQH